MRSRRGFVPAGLAISIVLGIAASTPSPAAGRGEPGPVFAMRLTLRDRLTDLKLLHDLDIDIDGVFGTWARVYVLPEELEKLTGLGFALTLLSEEGGPAAEIPFTPAAPLTVPTTSSPCIAAM